MRYFVYIMASRSRTLYVGVTNDLVRRVAEHRAGRAGSFTSRYQIQRLVFCEGFATPREAIAAEKMVKGWRRGKKIVLIETMNPNWQDLAEGWPTVQSDRGGSAEGSTNADPSLRSG